MFDSSPPADADPTKFVTGTAEYSNLTLQEVYRDDQVFRIDPQPVPWLSLWIMTLVFLVGCGGFYWVVVYGVPPGERKEWARWFVVGIFAMITIGSWWHYSHVYRAEQARGPWLIYVKSTGRLELPRARKSFDRGEIVQLEHITTKRLQPEDPERPQLTEINLITERDGVRQRHNLLGCYGWCDHLIRPLVQETGLPAVRIEDELFGWNVSEKPL